MKAGNNLSNSLSKALENIQGAKCMVISSSEGSELLTISKSSNTDECHLINSLVLSFVSSIDHVIFNFILKYIFYNIVLINPLKKIVLKIRYW